MKKFNDNDRVTMTAPSACQPGELINFDSNFQIELRLQAFVCRSPAAENSLFMLSKTVAKLNFSFLPVALIAEAYRKPRKETLPLPLFLCHPWKRNHDEARGGKSHQTRSTYIRLSLLLLSHFFFASPTKRGDRERRNFSPSRFQEGQKRGRNFPVMSSFPGASTRGESLVF